MNWKVIGVGFGKLIAIDGIDGSGKSTLAKKISKELHAEYFSVFDERYMITEISNVSKLLGKTYREVFTDRFINYAWLMDLFKVAYNDLNALLKNGKNVVLDRYVLSAKVYSLATTSADISNCFEIYTLVPNPDICLYLSLDVDVAIKRIKGREKEITFYENVDGLMKIAQQYEKIISKETQYPIEIIRSDDNLEKVYLNCLSVLSKYDII